MKTMFEREYQNISAAIEEVYHRYFRKTGIVPNTLAVSDDIYSILINYHESIINKSDPAAYTFFGMDIVPTGIRTNYIVVGYTEKGAEPFESYIDKEPLSEEDFIKCPNCGGVVMAEKGTGAVEGMYRLFCSNCKIKQFGFFSDFNKAVEAWQNNENPCFTPNYITAVRDRREHE